MSQAQSFVDNSKPQYVYRLKKVVYGLKQALKAWYDKLKQALLGRGFVNTISDSSLFKLSTKHVIVFVLIYVDHILLTRLKFAYIQPLIRDLNS